MGAGGGTGRGKGVRTLGLLSMLFIAWMSSALLVQVFINSFAAIKLSFVQSCVVVFMTLLLMIGVVVMSVSMSGE